MFFKYVSGSRGTRDPTFFDGQNFQEAISLFELKLHLIPMSSFPHEYTFINPRGPSTSWKFPNLYFSGTSRRVDGYEVMIYGVVTRGDDGVARWRYVSWRPDISCVLFGEYIVLIILP